MPTLQRTQVMTFFSMTMPDARPAHQTRNAVAPRPTHVEPAAHIGVDSVAAAQGRGMQRNNAPLMQPPERGSATAARSSAKAPTDSDPIIREIRRSRSHSSANADESLSVLPRDRDQSRATQRKQKIARLTEFDDLGPLPERLTRRESAAQVAPAVSPSRTRTDTMPNLRPSAHTAGSPAHGRRPEPEGADKLTRRTYLDVLLNRWPQWEMVDANVGK